MVFILVGLGNPGAEYENTRHNTGALVLDAFRKAAEFPKWSEDERRRALVSEGKVGKQKVLLIFPQTFMNKSGEALKKYQVSCIKYQGKNKEIPNLAVIHDDLDIPFGKYKISFNKSSGGHKGVESIIKAVKTQAFTRVRVGLASSQAAVRKSQDESAVEKTILGKFTPAELTELKKLAKRIAEGLACLITEGREKAMSQYHS